MHSKVLTRVNSIKIDKLLKIMALVLGISDGFATGSII